MTKWVHDLGLGLGPIPTREVSREELEKMYPPAKRPSLLKRLLSFLWAAGVGNLPKNTL